MVPVTLGCPGDKEDEVEPIIQEQHKEMVESDMRDGVYLNDAKFGWKSEGTVYCCMPAVSGGNLKWEMALLIERRKGYRVK